MATDSYLKVHRPPHCSIEFFFDSHNAISVSSAHRAARDLARAMTDLAQAEADAQGPNPALVAPTQIAVWTHGVRGLGDLHCIGGCELCSPRPDLEIVEAEDEDSLDTPPRAVLP